MGKNVLSLPANEQWAKHRRLLSPLFAGRFMRDYCTMIAPKLRSMTSRIRQDAVKSGAAGLDVLKVVSSTALDIIGICGFGVDFESVENQVRDCLEEARKLSVHSFALRDV